MIICYCFEKFSFLISKLRNIVKEKKRKKRSQLTLFFLSLSFCRCSRASGSKVPSVPFENKNIFFLFLLVKHKYHEKKIGAQEVILFCVEKFKVKISRRFFVCLYCIAFLFCFVVVSLY